MRREERGVGGEGWWGGEGKRDRGGKRGEWGRE
jgi:hypothetical protein